MNRRFFAVIFCVLLLVAAWLFFEFGKKSAASRRREIANVADAEAASAKAREAAEKKAKFLREWRESQKMRHVGTNAADIYRQAYELFTALSDEEKAMLNNPDKEIDVERAAELFKQLQQIMEVLHKANGADYCEWIPKKLTYNTLPNTAEMERDFGKVAIWSAAYKLQMNLPDMLGDLSVLQKFARTLPEVGVGLLEEIIINRRITEFLNQNASALDPDMIPRVIEILRENPYPNDVARALHGDLICELDYAANIPEGERLAEFDSVEKEGAATLEIIQIEERLIPSIAASDAQFKSAWEQAQVQVESNTLGKNMLRHFELDHNRVMGIEVQNAMLCAGLTILQTGTAQLGKFIDPSNGLPFIYSPSSDGGFELRSPFERFPSVGGQKSKPVTMRFSSSKFMRSE